MSAIFVQASKRQMLELTDRKWHGWTGRAIQMADTYANQSKKFVMCLKYTNNPRRINTIWPIWKRKNIMTSRYGKAFSITGPLRGESTGYRWIPLTKGQ